MRELQLHKQIQQKMLIEKIVGNSDDIEIGNRAIDLLQIEWFEITKRVQRRKSNNGTDIAIRFLKEGQCLKQNDILFMDDEVVVMVDILPCDAITIKPKSMSEMGRVCYEIGNKHLPIFMENDLILLPYEDPIFRWLNAMGFDVAKTHTKLLNIVNSTVQPHGQGSGNSSIFSKIIGLGKEKSN
jgi:urease accessory protein